VFSGKFYKYALTIDWKKNESGREFAMNLVGGVKDYLEDRLNEKIFLLNTL
jgi:hypothetical protein